MYPVPGPTTDLDRIELELVAERGPDETLDRYARLVRRVLGVPVGLVTLVEADRQCFVGVDGLQEPWATARETPLSHSFCRHVVADQRPLVVADARLDQRLRDNFAIPELGVVAYAGWPLTDHTGRVVGSLCAIELTPRAWTPDELLSLEDLAAACSSELVQRGLRKQAAEAAERSDHLARRSRVFLDLSEELSSTQTVEDIATVVTQVAVSHLGCRDAHLALSGGLWPAHVLPEQRRPPSEPGAALDESSGELRLRVPLTSRGTAFGTLSLAWQDRHLLTLEDRVTITALAAYTAEALDRALLLHQRQAALETLQRSLLAPLPSPAVLSLAARYRPAAVQDQVGGDWYDAVILPSGTTALMVGDVVGHDIEAAAMMGQLRTMLRTFASAFDEPASQTVARLDKAVGDLELPGMATLVHAVVEPDGADPGSGRHVLRWSNAGHPPPLLLAVDGSAHFLDAAEPDPMIGVVPGCARTDGRVLVEPGSTLLLYTDGLVERRDEDLDVGLDRLRRSAARHASGDLETLLDAVIEEAGPDRLADDVAVLAVRFLAS